MLCSLLVSACEDIEFLNLKRDNPLDGKNNENMIEGVALKFDSYNVYSDNNNDGVINKGETVRLNVSLKNNGTSTAKSVKATFSTTSQYVSGFSPTSPISYGDISAGYSVWKGGYSYASGYAVEFTVSNTTPVNMQIPISISMTDANGNKWIDTCKVTVSATGASVSYYSYDVYSDNNNDKKINKGETVKLNVSLRNTGSSTAKSVKATFSTTSSYVSGFSPTSPISYSDISAGYTVWKGGYSYASGYAIEFTVSNSIPANTQIPIKIDMVDESGNTWTSTFNLTVVATDANISYYSYDVYSDNNNDKKINKGETVKLNVSLRNTGSSTAKSVKATFSTTSSYVSGFSPTSPISYSDISAGYTVWKGGYSYASGYAIEFTVSSSTPINTPIPVNISIVDESNNTWSSSFNVIVQ